MPRKSLCFKMCFNNIKFAQDVCEVLIEINEKEWHEQLYIHKNSLGIYHYAEKVNCRNKFVDTRELCYQTFAMVYYL